MNSILGFFLVCLFRGLHLAVLVGPSSWFCTAYRNYFWQLRGTIWDGRQMPNPLYNHSGPSNEGTLYDLNKFNEQSS